MNPVLNALKLKTDTTQQRVFLFLLAYRWISLLVVIGLFPFTSDATVPDVSPIFLLIIAIVITLFISFFHHRLNRLLFEDPIFLAVDIFIAAVLLTLSGVTRSTYAMYALSPLLAAAFSFQMKGALRAVSGFTLLYLVALFIGYNSYPITIEPGLVLNQLMGMWLLTILFGSLSELFNQLEQTHDQLQGTRDDLTRQNIELAAARDNLSQQHLELTAAHHQLQVIHDLTLMLQGASDTKTAQHRVLQAVTEELGYTQAILGLVSPITNKLEIWDISPTNDNLLSLLGPLPLVPESGFLIQTLLAQRGCWCSTQQDMVTDKTLNQWFRRCSWLILPLILQEQLVGVLLVGFEGKSHNLSDDQLVVLSAVASQAAVALGTIDRVKQLAIEQERNRIARDIHDTVAQSLFGTVFTLDACIKMLPDHVETVQHELEDLRNLAEQVRQEVRHSILNIWPTELTLDQFKADIHKYVIHCSGSNEFHIDFTIGGDFDRLSPAIRRNLYRVTQEALANVAHHADVNSARVSLFVEADEVQLSIRDRGKGFDPKIALTRSHNRDKFGLRGMRERVENLNGQCEILSQIDHGTQVLVRIPTNGRRKNGNGASKN